VSVQNLIVALQVRRKIDRFEYAIETNSAPSIVEAVETTANSDGERTVIFVGMWLTCAEVIRRRPNIVGAWTEARRF